ncbi:MAG: sigma-70 family RNA polymerase sigma factor [Anaerolineae bacterium]
MNFTKRVSYASDPALVQRCLKGDESAWNELVERYSRLIYSIPRRYGLSEEDASDVVQNVLVIALKNMRSLRQQDRLSAWLITIAHHETLRLLRQGKHLVSEEVDVPDPLPPLTDDLQAMANGEILRQAMDRLDPTEREMILALLADPPPSFDELSAALKIPRGSIGYWRKRALERLKKHLTELGFYP